MVLFLTIRAVVDSGTNPDDLAAAFEELLQGPVEMSNLPVHSFEVSAVGAGNEPGEEG